MDKQQKYMMEGVDVSEKFVKLIEQNLLLVGEVRNLWEKTNQLVRMVKTLREEKNELKINVNELNAQTKKSNIEIRNIPEITRDDRLEEHCIDILKQMEIEVEWYNIVG